SSSTSTVNAPGACPRGSSYCRARCRCSCRGHDASAGSALMLRAVRSNRAEALVAALAAALPAADPFAPVPIVVGGHLIARWLTRELARARGIACGVEMLTFDRFVERTWGAPE